MFYRRQGYPEEGELVLCTVTKIQFHSVFVHLDEYGKNGMVHISEISPGRIRNINDFVQEGKVVVCVVLRVNIERQYIDVSLRRVNDNQKRKKLNTIKQEQKAEKIIEYVAEKLKMDKAKLYDIVASKILPDYGYLHTCFEGFIENKNKLPEFEPAIQAPLEEVIRQRIKPQEVSIEGKLLLKTYAPDGVEVLKTALIAAKKVSKNLDIKYLGGGKYHLTVKAREYKEAEKIVKDAVDTASKIVDATLGGQTGFERKETK